MKRWIAAILLTSTFGFAQGAKPLKTASLPGSDYTGMYSFIRDGEFVRINIDGSHLTGYISRRGDGEKQIFVAHFFDKAEFHDQDFQFGTTKVQGVWFLFKGTISRGSGKARNEEDYYRIKGTLTEYSSDANEKVNSKERELTLHSLPQDICE